MHKSHVEGLLLWKKDLYEQTKDNHTNFSRLIQKYLSSVFSITHSLYDSSLLNRLEVDSDY